MKRKLKRLLSKLNPNTKLRVLIAGALATALVVLNLSPGSKNSPEDIRPPTVYTCVTPFGAFQVSDDLVKVSRDGSVYRIESDDSVVTLDTANCISQRSK